jgi:tRNA modification GTPase
MSEHVRRRRSDRVSAKTPEGLLPRVRDDTIVALASAPGRGAIATIRVSGPDVESICRRVVFPWPARAREATRCRIHEPDDPTKVLDDAVVTVFSAPRTYTGEPLVELSTHGGEYVPAVVCAALVSAGARPAEAGEFTERAVLAGKLDLVRAEAVGDLIDARSRAGHRAALHQLSGALSAHLGRLRHSLVEIEALLAYEIDFPEEDEGRLPPARVVSSADSLIAQLEMLLATSPIAALGRDGATVVLAGPPNAGKSSLLNAIVGEERVIVSDLPGTTRDAVEVVIDHDPWPLRLVDTAGLREGGDPIERLGIEVSVRYLAAAHAVIVCAENVMDLRGAFAAVGLLTKAALIGALTKSDLVSNQDDPGGFTFPVVRVSATRGDGLGALLSSVTRCIGDGLGPMVTDTPVVTRARHRLALEVARRELEEFRDAWLSESLPAPVAAVHVRAAIRVLDELVGTVDIDEVFARVFATFCIGK